MKRPRGFEGFYFHHVGDPQLDAGWMLSWIVSNLDDFFDHRAYRWRVSFGYKADRLFRETFGEQIYELGRNDWMMIPSTVHGNRPTRVRISGAIGDIHDLDVDLPELDRIIIHLDIDDVDDMGWHETYW